MIPTFEEKQKIVLDHYQVAYRVQFKKPLDKKDVEFLYNQMIKLGWNLQNYIQSGAPAAKNLKKTPCLSLISDKSAS